ncbi:MAG: hypothetical protein ACFB03_20510 [Paracoccaceae bacterium]
MTPLNKFSFDNDIDHLVSWWRERDGLFVDLDNVLMKVAMHAKPSRQLGHPVPLLIGTESLHSRVLGSPNPKLLSLNIKSYFPEYASEVFDGYLYASDNFEPVQSVHSLVANMSEGPVDFRYERLLLPVRTRVGAEAILTYSRPIQLN